MYFLVNPELQNTSKANELGKEFNEVPVGDGKKIATLETEPEIPEIKPEPDPKKLRFNYATHLIERLTKMPMEYGVSALFLPAEQLSRVQ